MITGLPEASLYTAFTGYQPNIEAKQFLVFFEGQFTLNLFGCCLWNSCEIIDLDIFHAIVIGTIDSKPVAILETGGVPGNFETISIRQLMSTTSENTFSLLSHGLQILISRKEHRYCGYCGAENHQAQGEWAMVCSQCEYHSYPRISPCIIVLIERGD
ncbi:MAG: NADH pyrophosphatase zinc ribbon domain-containing protein, partial [Endozoicomonas sp.]